MAVLMIEALGFWVLSLFPEMGFVCSFRSNSLPYDLFTYVYNLMCVYMDVFLGWVITHSLMSHDWSEGVSDRREWAHYKQLYKRLYHCVVCVLTSLLSAFYVPFWLLWFCFFLPSLLDYHLWDVSLLPITLLPLSLPLTFLFPFSLSLSIYLLDTYYFD